MHVWHEDDELWDEAVGWMLRERAENASDETDHLLELTGVRPPGKEVLASIFQARDWKEANGDLDGPPYDNEGSRMTVVGRK